MIRLFSKTWTNDYGWLKLAIKSVLKLSTEAVEWTIVGDQGSRQAIDTLVLQAVQESKGALKYDIHEIQELWPECSGISNGYLSQQWVKMNAHRAIKDGYFLNWDSDVIAVRPFSSKDFIGKSEKPIYWFSQFNGLIMGGDRDAHEGRMSMMREVFHLEKISFEWMRCMPIWLNGQILSHASTQAEWSRAFDMLRKGDHRFSEFNIIGQFCHLYYPDAFEWKNAENSGPAWAGGWDQNGNCFQAHAKVSQGFSWGGVPGHVDNFVNNL